MNTATAGAVPRDGEPSLALSFWLAFALPWVLAHAVLDGTATWLNLHGAPLVGGSIVLLLGWPLAMLMLAWGSWRTWRAATAHAAAGGAPLWRLLGLAAMALALLFTVATWVVHVAPRVPEIWHRALGSDTLAPAQLSQSAEGHKQRLQGTLALGDGERIAALLRQAGPAKLLELQSSGGHRAEAQRVAATLAADGWHTRVVGPCDLACVEVFLAGRGRQLMPEGRLGLHRLAPASLNPLWRTWARREEAAQWQQAGLPQPLLRKALSATPTRPWHPEIDELVAEGVVGVPGRPLDVVLPTADATAAEWLDALRSNPVWLALDRRLPGTVAAAAEPMPAAVAAGMVGAQLQAQAQRAVQARLPELLRSASTALREHHVGLQAERLAALGPAPAESCRRLLAADPALLRELPVALRQREAAWLTDAATELPEARPPRRLNALELEVLSRAMGERAPGLLVALGRPEGASGPAMGCALAAQLLAEVLRLPVAERRLALRQMYDRN